MKRSSCPRLFEVEALRDGRLGEAERASFERHLTTCAACSQEAEELAELGRALRACEQAPADELHSRRERTRLLAAFDQALLGRASPGRTRRKLVTWVSVAALSAAIVLAFWSTRSDSPLARSGSTSIRASTGSVWSRRTHDDREQIHLEQGALWIQVVSASPARPLVVVLPDGELEDIGTTFSVTVDAGRTTRVDVEEGSVLLRLRGRAPRAIAAGETWAAAQVFTAPRAEARIEPPPLPNPSPAPASAPRSAAALLRDTAAPAPRATLARPSPPPPPSKAPAHDAAAHDAPSKAPAYDAADDFRAAVEALDDGHNRQAAAKFERFVERHAGDPRAEDAAYLLVLALQRDGDDARMKAAARQYLRNYPAGFRRVEVERLAE